MKMEAETAVMSARSAGSHQKLDEAGRVLSWSLRDHSATHSFVSRTGRQSFCCSEPPGLWYFVAQP